MSSLFPAEQTLIEDLGSVKYIGVAAYDALKSSLAWRIARVSKFSGQKIIEWANGSQAGIFSWDNRASYFGAAPIDAATILFNQTDVIADFTSNVFNISSFRGFALETFWSNSAGLDAVLYGQVSIDGINFTNHPLMQITINSDDSFMWNVEGVYYKYARVKAVFTAGQADFLINASGKGF